MTSLSDGDVDGELWAAWQALSARAAKPNPFCHPALVIPWLEQLPRRDRRVLLAWRREADKTPTLVGALPIVFEGLRYRLLRIVKQPEIFGAWTPPLLDADQPSEVLNALLEFLAQTGAVSLLLPYVQAQGPVSDAIRRWSAGDGRSFAVLRRHDRAMFVTGTPAVEQDAKRVRRCAKLRRRLSEQGDLRFGLAETDAAIAALERFMALEAAGWKGRQRTAFAATRGGSEFLRDALALSRRGGPLQIAELSLDGKVIASALVLTAQRQGFYFKIAHDPAFAFWSPGILLTLALTDMWRDDPVLRTVDSLATADHPMINRIWKDRVDICAVLLDTGRTGRWAFRLSCWFERMRERVRESTGPLRRAVRKAMA